MDSVEISWLFQWKCNMRAKRFYSVGLFLHNCCHLYLYGALIVFGCSEAVRNAVLMTSSSVTIISASRWSGSATARRTARWAKTKETAKEQVKKNKTIPRKSTQSGFWRRTRAKNFKFFCLFVTSLIERKSFILSRSDSPSRPTGVRPPQPHALMRRRTAAAMNPLWRAPFAEMLHRSSKLWKTYESSSWLTPAAFPVLPTCSVNEYVCASGGCVSASLRCDGHDNCLDGSDEVSARLPSPAPPPPPAPFIKTLFSTPTVASYPLEHQRTFPRQWKGWKVLTSVASCPGRSAAWKSAGRTSSSVWTERTASRGVGAATTSSTAWTTATRKTAARVGGGVHALRRRDSVMTQMVW